MKLRQWYQVHGLLPLSPAPAVMLDAVRPVVDGLGYDFDFTGDEWHKGSFRRSDEAAPALVICRMLPGEDGFVRSNQGWDKHLELMDAEPNRNDVVQHIRRCSQTVSLKPIGGGIGRHRLARVCEQLCGYLARASDGLIQVYQEGFFTADGESLFPKNPRHRLITR